MFTPRRPVKRKLFFTPRSVKRARFTPATAYRGQNRFTTRGVSKKGGLFQQVKALQTFVNKLKPEIKYVDIDLAQTNIVAATGSATHITGIAQGDTQSTRTGNSVNVLNIKCNVRITRGGATAGVNAGVRFAIVQDKEHVGDTQPTANAVFETVSAFDVLPDLANLERFRILYLSPYMDGDMMVLGTDDGPATRTNVLNIYKSVNIKVSFNGTAATDMEKNNLYFITMSTDLGDTLDITGTARVGYTDV